MEGLYVRAVVAGIFFGIWPLLMQRSGLNGMFSAFLYVGIVLICVAPFALSNIGSLENVQWWMVAGAGLTGAIGIIAFNDLLAKTTVDQVGMLFVVMILVQVLVPAIYHVVTNGGLSFTKGIGFVLAAGAAYCLIKG